MNKKRKYNRPSPNELDPIIHERLRLGILSALVASMLSTSSMPRFLARRTSGVNKT